MEDKKIVGGEGPQVRPKVRRPEWFWSDEWVEGWLAGQDIRDYIEQVEKELYQEKLNTAALLGRVEALEEELGLGWWC